MKSRARVNNTALIDSDRCLIISNHTFQNTNVSLNDKILAMLQIHWPFWKLLKKRKIKEAIRGNRQMIRLEDERLFKKSNGKHKERNPHPSTHIHTQHCAACFKWLHHRIAESKSGQYIHKYLYTHAYKYV